MPNLFFLSMLDWSQAGFLICFLPVTLSHKIKTMKNPLLFLLFLLGAIGVKAQQSSCCAPAKEAHSTFASLGEDAKFRNAHQQPREFELVKGKGKMISFDTPDEGSAKGYYLKGSSDKSNFLFVIHEWWGLNDHIKAEAERLQTELGGEIHVIALDMYDGKVATTREKAAEYMKGMPAERGLAIIQGALAWAGEDAKVGTIGWCFGGGWSLQASIEAADQGVGCVIYYGMPEKDNDRLEGLEADVLGIFASKDQWINEGVVEEFEQSMDRVGKNLEFHIYEAEHAFANPSRDIYDKEAATQANDLVIDFFGSRLK